MARSFAVSVLLFCSLSARGQIPSIELKSLSQPVAQIGSEIERFTLTGKHTGELDRLLFSKPGIVAIPLAEPAGFIQDNSQPSGQFKLVVEASATPGLCEVRGVGRWGLSNPRRLLITAKPSLVVAGNCTDPSTAYALGPALTPDQASTILLGRCEPQKRQYFSIQLKAGEHFRGVVYAKSLDSLAVPLVTLHGPGKHRPELMRSRAAGYWPAELQFTVTQTGEYILALHDFLFQGGPDYAYALQYSIGNSASTARSLELDRLLRPSADIRSPASELGRFVVDEPTPTNKESVKLLPATDAVTVNEIPFEVAGRFTQPSQQSFDFFARRDQQLWISVQSHALGQLTDPRVVIRKLNETEPAGKPHHLLEHDDQPALGDAAIRIHLRDPQFSWKVPEDSRYRLEVIDSQAGARPDDATGYVLSVSERLPQFKVLAYWAYPTQNPATSIPSSSQLLRGGADSIRVVAFRMAGFQDAIEVFVENQPMGISAAPCIIPPSASEASITLVCDEDAQIQPAPILVMARALPDGNKQAAMLATTLWPANPFHNAVTARLCDELYVGVRPHDIAPVLVKLGDGATLDVKQGDKLTVPIQLVRRTGGGSACVLRPQQLPTKSSMPEVTVPADKSEAVTEIVIAGDTPLGEYSFWLQCETKIKWRDNPQSLTRAEANLQSLQDKLSNLADPDEKPRLESAIQTAKQGLESAKLSTAEKELTVWLPSTIQRIRVIGPAAATTLP